jgi:hypothetical protein
MTKGGFSMNGSFLPFEGVASIQPATLDTGQGLIPILGALQ